MQQQKQREFRVVMPHTIFAQQEVNFETLSHVLQQEKMGIFQLRRLDDESICYCTRPSDTSSEQVSGIDQNHIDDVVARAIISCQSQDAT